MDRYSPRALGNPNLVMCHDSTGRWVKYSKANELEAQLEQTDFARKCLIYDLEKLETQLAGHKDRMKAAYDRRDAAKRGWVNALNITEKAEAQLEKVLRLPRHSILTGGMVEVPHGQWVNIEDIRQAILEKQDG